MKALFVACALVYIGLSYACTDNSECTSHNCDENHHPTCTFGRCVCRLGGTHKCANDNECTFCDANHHGLCSLGYCRCAIGGASCSHSSDCSVDGSTTCTWHGLFGQPHDGHYHCDRGHCHCR